MDYTIIAISDRASDNTRKMRQILSSWNEIDDNRAIDGRVENAFSILYNLGFSLNYCPDDGRIDPMMPTEAGVFASHILAMENALHKNIKEFVIFEDDAILSSDFCSVFDSAMSAAPEGWDFISFIVEESTNKETPESLIGSDIIHECLYQPSYLAAVLYSDVGMNKFIQHIRDAGIYYNVDSMLYRASHSRILNGYILRNSYSYAVTHDPNLIASDIDPENKRHSR